MTYEEMARHRICGAWALIDHYEKVEGLDSVSRRLRRHLMGFFPEEHRLMVNLAHREWQEAANGLEALVNLDAFEANSDGSPEGAGKAEGEGDAE